jgi:hypothetical protein
MLPIKMEQTRTEGILSQTKCHLTLEIALLLKELTLTLLKLQSNKRECHAKNLMYQFLPNLLESQTMKPALNQVSICLQ